ncbi:MAG: hypothetical protein H8E28_13485 [Anaerolineae bacterium]|nr:hypothetical protein [Anaerolineae bacterium]
MFFANIRNLLYLSLIEGGVSFIALLLIPRDVSNVGILGFSSTRFALLVGVLVYILFFAGIAIYAYHTRRFYQRVKNILEILFQNENRTHTLFFILLSGILLCTGVLVSWLFVHRGYYPMLLRISPIVAMFVFQGVQTLIFLVLSMTTQQRQILREKLLSTSLVLFISLILGAVTVYIQIRWKGLDWLIEGTQYQRHQAVLTGVAGNPWQYRVFSDYLVELMISVLRKLDVTQPEVIGFISLRFAQGVLIFWVAAAYYRALGLNRYTVILGVALLASAFPPAYYDSDLQFNTYFDILFYLLAGLSLLKKKPGWIIPIIILAAFNRETSGLIPIMLVGDLVYQRQLKEISKKDVSIAVIAGLLYGLIFFGLRKIFGPQELLIPYEQHPGPELFNFNVQRSVTWVQLFNTLGILPFLALFSFKKWPRALQSFSLVIIPVWIPIHFFYSVLAETRLLLVPFALIFVPGALLGIANFRGNDDTVASA